MNNKTGANGTCRSFGCPILVFAGTLSDNAVLESGNSLLVQLMFNNLKAMEPDPILGLMSAFGNDTNPRKVDLGVGVYKDDAGNTPVLDSVKAAEALLLERQQTKAYIGPAGLEDFNRLMQVMILGPAHPVLAGSRAATIQTPGGCGALRAGAELIRRARPGAKIWVSDPTWANHIPLLGSAGMEIVQYPYYDSVNKVISFDAMLETLRLAEAGDVLLLHGCCHNPCGADLDLEQWQVLAELALQRDLLPFVDLAYQGFGEGIEEDVAGLRLLASRVPEMLVASSCSKNFGLYRDRTGSLTVVARDSGQVNNAISQVCSATRGIWSMPPDHGAAVVATILSDMGLRAQWEAEVATMRKRINDLRTRLVDSLASAGAGDFSFIARECGMFSFLGISPDSIASLRREFSIYMVDSSRINVAGLSDDNIAYVSEAIATVCRDSRNSGQV